MMADFPNASVSGNTDTEPVSELLVFFPAHVAQTNVQQGIMQRYGRKPFLMISIVLLIQIWDHYFIVSICMKLWNYFACDGYSANISSIKSSALYIFFLPQTSLKNKIHWYYSAFELEPILLWPATFYGGYNHTWFCAGAGMVIGLEITLKSTSFSPSCCTVLWNISDVGAIQLGEKKKQTPYNDIMKTQITPKHGQEYMLGQNYQSKIKCEKAIQGFIMTITKNYHEQTCLTVKYNKVWKVNH